MKSLYLPAFGKPTTAPELIETEAPQPRAGQLLVALEASPINPSDLLLIRGFYGHRPALPAALGSRASVASSPWARGSIPPASASAS